MSLDLDANLNSAARKTILSRELDAVLAKLDHSFAQVVADVEEHLFAKAESSGSNRERQGLLDAYNNLRSRRGNIELQFKKTFRDLLDQSVANDTPVKAGPMSDLDWDSLSLVDTDQMEEDVQVKRLADKIKSSVEWELRDLNARMSYLLGREGSEEGNNPLRPELFCRALGKACAELETDHQTRLEVMRSFESALSQNISVVYHDLNERLISHKVLPKIRHVASPTRSAEKARPREEAPVEDEAPGISPAELASKLNRIDTAVENVVESTLSMFEALQKLVGNTPAYRNAFGPGAESAPGIGSSRRNLMSAVHELREAHALALDLPALDTPTQFNSPNFPGAINLAPNMMPNFIWANREQLSAAAGNNVDRMKIDIVAMLFDQILADEKLPAEFKMLLGRLQLPVLRVALADGSFFATRAHPTRRLIDRIASCAVGYESRGEGNQRFFAEVERIVLEILRNVEEDVELYGRLLVQFETFLQSEHKQANDIVGRAADVLERAEVREVLSINATIQVNQLLYGVNIDPFLRAFLLDVWTHVLVEVACLCEDSKTDPTVTRYKQLCVDLVWSAQAKATPEDRRRLVELLPRMIGCIREGLALIGYPPDQETRFFAELMQIHSNAVRTSSGPVNGIDIDQFTERLRQMVVEHDINAITIAPDMKISDQSARRVESESQGEVELDRVGAQGPITVPGEVKADDETVSRWVDSLERGMWLEMKIGEDFTRVRLAWISPLKSFYLFVGVPGQRAHSLHPDALRSKFRESELRFVEDETLVDRAVRSVMSNLERQGAPA